MNQYTPQVDELQMRDFSWVSFHFIYCRHISDVTSKPYIYLIVYFLFPSCMFI